MTLSRVRADQSKSDHHGWPPLFTRRDSPSHPLGPTPDDREKRLLARAKWTLVAQLVCAFTVIIVLVGGVALMMMIAGQGRDARRDLAVNIVRADILHPPPCVWLFHRDPAGKLVSSPGSPTAMPVKSLMDESATTGRTTVVEMEVNGLSYVIRTERRNGNVYQAVTDLRYQLQERQRLYAALAIAELGGILGAMLIGPLLSRRAMAPMREALARQSRFVADASHELRTPLTRLHTRAQLLTRQSDHAGTSADLGGELRAMVLDTQHMGEVIEDLLLSARLRTDRGADARPVELGAIVREVISAESARARTNGVHLETTGGSAEYTVLGVQAALRRVVSALVDNAFGHTPPGGHIRVELAREGDRIRVSVCDDGVGFDPADAELLFQRFARGAESTGSGRRFGLGLALVREVVDSHGGVITAHARPGAGATFTLRLPAALEPPAAPAEPATKTGVST